MKIIGSCYGFSWAELIRTLRKCVSRLLHENGNLSSTSVKAAPQQGFRDGFALRIPWSLLLHQYFYSKEQVFCRRASAGPSTARRRRISSVSSGTKETASPIGEDEAGDMLIEDEKAEIGNVLFIIYDHVFNVLLNGLCIYNTHCFTGKMACICLLLPEYWFRGLIRHHRSVLYQPSKFVEIQRVEGTIEKNRKTIQKYFFNCKEVPRTVWHDLSPGAIDHCDKDVIYL